MLNVIPFLDLSMFRVIMVVSTNLTHFTLTDERNLVTFYIFLITSPDCYGYLLLTQTFSYRCE